MGKLSKTHLISLIFLFSMLLCGSGVQATESNWNLEMLSDTDDAANWGFSIVMDSTGNPHISYWQVENWETGALVKYAEMSWSTWHVQTVDKGQGSSLALDSHGNPHICYQGDSGGLKYASLKDSAWNTQMVDQSGIIKGASIAVDSDGNPHISYSGRSGLEYASWTGSDWCIQTVQTLEPTEDNSLDNPLWTSLALDHAGNPHIAYGISKELRYAYWTGSEWSVQYVDKNSGRSCSLALDSKDIPHITYERGQTFKYTSWTGTGWNILTVDDGEYSSLALDRNDNPHISYTRGWSIHYASWNGTGFSLQTVDPETNMGFTAIALDFHGYPHICYSDQGFSMLQYATNYQQTIPPEISNVGTPVMLFFVIFLGVAVVIVVALRKKTSMFSKLKKK